MDDAAGRTGPGGEPEAEAAFRAEARRWLEANASRRDGTVPQSTAMLAQRRGEAEIARVRSSQAWQAQLAEAGWAVLTWPVDCGGRGLMARYQTIFDEEQAAFDVPSAGVFAQGIGMAGPTIIAHGTTDQKHRFLPPMLRGDELWCQLFSEPGAGSDLASLATRAVRDGDEFVVNGQKVWTSSAHYSDWAILLARTDWDVPKHRGITYFLVDMHTPGIEVRPLRQPTGVAHFNEVFLTDVRIPADNVVGAVNDGWRVAMTTLTNERTLIGSSGGSQVLEELIALYRSRPRDAVTRQRLIKAYIASRVIQLTGLRVKAAIEQGQQPGSESSVLKLAYSVQQGVIGNLGVDLLGANGTLLDYAELDVYPWASRFLMQWSSRIGGGTEQVQRNIIGERILGLPREPAVDRDVPFRSLLRSTR